MWHHEFLSMFVGAALGFIFANAWNSLAMTMFANYEKKDPVTGKPRNPVLQMFLYALLITLVCAGLVYYVYNYTGMGKTRK